MESKQAISRRDFLQGMAAAAAISAGLDILFLEGTNTILLHEKSFLSLLILT